MAKKRWIFWLIAFAVLAVAGVAFFKVGLHQIDLARYPQKYSDPVERYAAEYQVDPLLLYSIIRTESGFDPEATSGVGARGLMQITEETFVWIKSKIAREEEITFDDLYTAETNIRFGAYYFSVCLTRYQNDISTAAAAYHSGWGTVDRLLEKGEYSTGENKALHTFPYEQMQLYVKKINRSYEKYQMLYANTENEG